MRRLQLFLAFTILTTCASHAQTVVTEPGGKAEAILQRNALLFDLQALEADALKLTPPLAQARAFQSANALQDRLPRIAALAAICRAKAEAITKESKL